MDRYRFSGFQMPTITLDDGFEYAISLGRSEYSQGEPGWWHEQATYEGGGLDGVEYSNPGGDVPIL
jgi:hypothetical protein